MSTPAEQSRLQSALKARFGSRQQGDAAQAEGAPAERRDEQRAAPERAAGPSGAGQTRGPEFRGADPRDAGTLAYPHAAVPPAGSSSAVGAPAPAVHPGGQPGGHPVARGRRARLRLQRVDPWSVMKMAFLLSIAAGIVAVVAVFLLWTVLDSMGVFASVGSTVQDITGTDTSEGFDLVELLALRRVLGFATLLAVVNIVLVTALATLWAFLYNIAASFAGGLEVTLTDD